MIDIKNVDTTWKTYDGKEVDLMEIDHDLSNIYNFIHFINPMSYPKIVKDLDQVKYFHINLFGMKKLNFLN